MNEIEIFEGKIVSFGIGSTNLAMKNITFSTINNVLFITGFVPKGATDNDLALNNPCGIAWSSVTEYLVFNTEEDYVAWVNSNS